MVYASSLNLVVSIVVKIRAF